MVAAFCLTDAESQYFPFPSLLARSSSVLIQPPKHKKKQLPPPHWRMELHLPKGPELGNPKSSYDSGCPSLPRARKKLPGVLAQAAIAKDQRLGGLKRNWDLFPTVMEARKSRVPESPRYQPIRFWWNSYWLADGHHLSLSHSLSLHLPVRLLTIVMAPPLWPKLTLILLKPANTITLGVRDPT